MFRKLFGRSKKPKNTEPKTPTRDLFRELFPLTEAHKKVIEERLLGIQHQMFGKEGLEKIHSVNRVKADTLATYHTLKFNTLGWNLEEEKDDNLFYGNEFRDYLKITRISPKEHN